MLQEGDRRKLFNNYETYRCYELEDRIDYGKISAIIYPNHCGVREPVYCLCPYFGKVKFVSQGNHLCVSLSIWHRNMEVFHQTLPEQVHKLSKNAVDACLSYIITTLHEKKSVKQILSILFFQLGKFWRLCLNSFDKSALNLWPGKSICDIGNVLQTLCGKVTLHQHAIASSCQQIAWQIDAVPSQEIHIQFPHINLVLHDKSCRIHFIGVTDISTKPVKMGRHCGRNKNVEFSSRGNQVIVEIVHQLSMFKIGDVQFLYQCHYPKTEQCGRFDTVLYFPITQFGKSFLLLFAQGIDMRLRFKTHVGKYLSLVLRSSFLPTCCHGGLIISSPAALPSDETYSIQRNIRVNRIYNLFVHWFSNVHWTELSL